MTYTSKNTHSLLNFYKTQSTSNFSFDNIPIGVGAAQPTEGKFHYAYDFHGKNGLGIDLVKGCNLFPSPPARITAWEKLIVIKISTYFKIKDLSINFVD